MDRQANKHDAGKTRFDLLPVESLKAAADVLQYGANKYSEGSWAHVPDWHKRYKASVLRHVLAEERYDESGFTHLQHALTNLMIMVALEEREWQKHKQ